MRVVPVVSRHMVIGNVVDVLVRLTTVNVQLDVVCSVVGADVKPVGVNVGHVRPVEGVADIFGAFRFRFQVVVEVQSNFISRLDVPRRSRIQAIEHAHAFGAIVIRICVRRDVHNKSDLQLAMVGTVLRRGLELSTLQNAVVSGEGFALLRILVHDGPGTTDVWVFQYDL